MKVYYSPSYTAATEGFDTVVKSRWIAASLAGRPLPNVNVLSPASANPCDLELAHDRAYIDSVRSGSPVELAESQGFEWDMGLWTSVAASTGGVVAAAASAMIDGVSCSLSSGLHHARRDSGGGFCTINGLAVAAKSSLREGANSVAILDLDAHCGGGTASIIEGDPAITQIDVSVSPFDSYRDTDNSTLWLVDHAPAYLPAVEDALLRLTSGPTRPDLVLYNAGVDPYEGCGIGGLPGITRPILAARERIVFAMCADASFPVALVLAGGYVGKDLSADHLVDLHRLAIDAASRTLDNGEVSASEPKVPTGTFICHGTRAQGTGGRRHDCGIWE